MLAWEIQTSWRGYVTTAPIIACASQTITGRCRSTLWRTSCFWEGNMLFCRSTSGGYEYSFRSGTGSFCSHWRERSFCHSDMRLGCSGRNSSSAGKLSTKSIFKCYSDPIFIISRFQRKKKKQLKFMRPESKKKKRKKNAQPKFSGKILCTKISANFSGKFFVLKIQQNFGGKFLH